MGRRASVWALLIAAAVVMALLAVFAVELSDTQAKSKQDVEARVHERAVLAGALIDSLFGSVGQQQPQQVAKYGTRAVSDRTMNRNLQQGNAYLVLLDQSGRVIASSNGFSAGARAALASSGTLSILDRGKPYALGNVVRYGGTQVINYAVAIPTPYGVRTLITGFAPAALSEFLRSDLSQIPGVKGTHNYVLDGNDTVLASTNPAKPSGYVFTTPQAVTALKHSSGDASGHYYDQVPLQNSTWRIVISAPNGPLFASVTGLRKWIPWAIFLAFALVAFAALELARRSISAARKVRQVNAKLELLNGELAVANGALERRARELARSNTELEQFASIASHDLQEPLRKVRTFTQQVSAVDGERLSAKGLDYLHRSNQAAERMQKLIEDLLKFSRVGTHRHPIEDVDLGELTQEVLEDLQAQLERSGANVEVGELPTIGGDALQMRQLMQNLISNAIKFRRDGVPPEVTVEGQVHDDRATITVKDNGIGFEPQYSRRIFRVFERLHSRSDYPGTGIGLALCAKIAERHGGSILAESEPGVGSTFTITLPVSQREHASDNGQPSAVHPEELARA